MKKCIYFSLFIGLLLLSSCMEVSKKETNTTIANATKLPFFNSGDFTPEWIDISEKKYQEIHQIPDFSFVNQEGKNITQEDYTGKIYVADFFFTRCAGICRSLSLNMKSLQDAFLEDSEVLFLSHSVTPQMDSIPILKKYAETYGVDNSKWNLVTGDKDEIYELARTAYFSDEDFEKTKEASEFIHTENFLLIDKKGRIRGVYNGTLKLEMKRLIKHISLLKKEG